LGTALGIHPTAVVDPRAQLGPGVRVGAYSVIGAEVTLEGDVEVGHHVVLEGQVMVGPRARIGHGSLLGGVPQDLKFKPGTRSGVRIGADTTVREYVTIHRATRQDGWTEVGEGCLLMAMCHVAHDCRLGRGVIVINYGGLTGHVEVGERATIGGLTGIVPFARIGSFAYVGGCSKIVADVPPYMMVDGVPATARGVNVVGLRRSGMAAADRRLLQDAYRLLYRSGLTPPRAVAAIRETLPATPALTTLVEFIAAGSRRGICGPPRGGRAVAPEPGEGEAVV
jgi:UDP-N-acetylglucosamine acyltransferase